MPDCWLSAHLPNLDPSPTAPSEAQITLSNLLEQHTHTIHYYCSGCTGKWIQELDTKSRIKRKEKKWDGECWSQHQKTRQKDLGKTKRRVFSLNMHISSVGARGEGGGEEVDRECERTLTDRWSPHAVSFDGWSRELVNIHGPRPPALSAVSAQPRVDWWEIFFSFTFQKRLSHNNIVVDLGNINNTSPSVVQVWFIHLPLCKLERRRRKRERGDWHTLTAWGVFSLYLCVTKATPGTAGVSGNSFRENYWSYWALLLYITTLCPHPYTLRETLQEQGMLKVTIWLRQRAVTGSAYLFSALTASQPY